MMFVSKTENNVATSKQDV